MFSSVHLLRHLWLFAPPWTTPCQASLSITNSQSLLKLTSIASSVIPFSSHLQSFPASGSFPVSQFFASGGQNIEFQLQHQSFQWIFRTDFLYDEQAGSPCSPRDSLESSPTPQFKSINSLALSFHIVQLSHPYMTTGKTTALTRQTFVGNVSAF